MNSIGKLILVRHAESVRNNVKRGATFYRDDAHKRELAGIPDHQIPLTDTGRAHALATGIAFKTRYGIPDVMLHSGYLRTRETMAGLLAAYTPSEQHAITQTHHHFLRERDAGFGYDMTGAEALTAFPWLDAYWKMQGMFLARPPGGESFMDVTVRMRLLLDDLGRQFPGKTIVAVSHGGTIRATRFLLEGWTFDDLERPEAKATPPNCSVTEFAIDPAHGRFTCIEANRVLA